MGAGYWGGRTVVVTGGGGFIGSHFVDELLAHGATVVRVYRNSAPRLSHERLCDVRVDLSDEAAVRGVFEGADAVVHCAAFWGRAGFRYEHPASVFEANFRPVANVLKSAQEHGVGEVVLIGSGEVYRSEGTRLLREDDDFRSDPQAATDGYYLAKLYEEMLAGTYRHEYGMRVFRPRLTGIYGPGDNFAPGTDRVIPTMLARAAAGEEIVIWGDGSQTRTYMHVEDLVRAVLQLVEQDKYQTANVGTAETVSVRQLAQLVFAAVGMPERISFDTDKPIGRSSRTLDLTRMQSIIDFEPRSLREGLQQTADWYRSTLH